MSRYVNGVDTPDQPKPESEIAAVVGNIVKLQPDILAVQEMGPRDQFGDFVARLKAAGLNFEHTKLLDAHDQARHLGLLSKFPIVADNSVADAFYELNGVQEPVQRGFLDVTLEIQPGYRLRCITAHLKSKRPVPQGEAMMRRFEGRLLRQHIDKILADQPDTRLYVCGDLNDTKNEDVIKDIIGVKGSHTYMGDLWLKDSRGERWTHFYATGDSYARIDYFLISPALWRDVDKKAGGIFDEPTWSDASDHRPIWAVLRIPAAH
jgi:endonuclease/exonuclease/phosphatase family metal-dependent hydrolase